MKFFEDIRVGEADDLGSHTFTAESIKAFAYFPIAVARDVDNFTDGDISVRFLLDPARFAKTHLFLVRPQDGGPHAPAVIDAGAARHVYVTVPGTVVAAAATGATIREDEPVAVLENRELRLEIARLTGQRNEQKLRLDNLKRRQTGDAAAGAPRAAVAVAPTTAPARTTSP